MIEMLIGAIAGLVVAVVTVAVPVAIVQTIAHYWLEFKEHAKRLDGGANARKV